MPWDSAMGVKYGITNKKGKLGEIGLNDLINYAIAKILTILIPQVLMEILKKLLVKN